MSSLRSLGLMIALTGAGSIAGCAPAKPPQDLVSARIVYDRASKGPAQQHNPRDMDTARKQLELAEASFADDGDTQDTRDQSYLALRKAELAEVIGRTRQSTQGTEGVVDAMHADEKKVVARTSAELNRTKTELAAQAVALENETARRKDAEKRAAQAAADLAKFATVKQEARGMVITLSGSVLFASAKWDLLPAAQVRLNDVANALTKEDPHSKMVVEGHTDSQGQPAYNLELSQNRARAVRDYLVTRGIAGDRITAQGFGPTRSIADNGSAEGRANNRRVEIVVMPTSAAP
jgi:outer membrane protein OmpA-like peptidoglycan-associated protein